MHRSPNLQVAAVVSRGIAALALIFLIAVLAACGTEKGSPTAASPSPSEASPSAPTASANAQGSSSEAPDSPRSIVDELGHEVALPDKPIRVFAPYMEDSLLSIGVLPVAQWGNGDRAQEYLQDRLADVPKIDFVGGLPPSPEAVMALEPDLIILHTAMYAENGVYENYSKIAPTYVFKNAAGDLESSITKLGELLDRSAEAEQTLQAYHRKVEEAKARLDPVMKDKRAALMNFNGKGMFLIGGNYFGGFVLSHELGIAASQLVEGKNSVDLSEEILPELGVDYIFTINYGGTGTASMKEMTESAVWKSMPAAKNGQVYEVSDQYWTGSGLIAYGKIIDDVVGLIAP
ncbi:ABC transporter substrate-binding protein [Cohnella boryungensis]|uniref:ABC transporter substrate-binding protein n=1 Tax=Cohnella boryungensis TaxID=768479 RepID=A0ABV8SL80_9BACL